MTEGAQWANDTKMFRNKPAEVDIKSRTTEVIVTENRQITHTLHRWMHFVCWKVVFRRIVCVRESVCVCLCAKYLKKL